MSNGSPPVDVTARWYTADIERVREVDPHFEQRPRSEKAEVVRYVGRDDSGGVHNIVTNGLLQAFVDAADPNQASTTPATHIALGTGFPSEDPSATALASEQLRVDVVDSTAGESTVTVTGFIDGDEANGLTITEFGLTTAASGGTLLNRANISGRPIRKTAGITATVDVGITLQSVSYVTPQSFIECLIVGATPNGDEPWVYEFAADDLDPDFAPLSNLGNWESGGAIDWATADENTDPSIYYTFNFADETFNGYDNDSWDTTLSVPSSGIPSEAPLAFDGDGGIWTIGGYSKDVSNREAVGERVARYDIATDSWDESYTNLSLDISGHHVERVESWLYVIGGYTVASGASDPANNMARYNWETDTWDYTPTDIPSGPIVANAFPANQATAIGRSIHVVVENQHLRYDVFDDEWEELSPMNDTDRRYHALESDGEKLYAFGGEDAVTSVSKSSIESYDPATDSWTTESSTMAQARPGMCAAAHVTDINVIIT